MVIFGFGPGQQEDLGEVVPAVCPNCHNQVYLHHVRSKKTVRLYFVPVVPYGTDDYLVCPICSRGLQLSRTQLTHVRSMSTASASYRAGRLTDAQYTAQAERFWRQLGVNPAGQQFPAPAAPGASAPAQPATRARPATPTRPASAQPATAPAQPVTPAQPVAPAQPSAAAADDESPWVSQLLTLTQLHDQGVLSDADYEAAKRRVLGQK